MAKSPIFKTGTGSFAGADSGALTPTPSSPPPKGRKNKKTKKKITPHCTFIMIKIYLKMSETQSGLTDRELCLIW
jgi:hypothetical protein